MRFPLGWNDAQQSLVDEVAKQDAHHPDGEIGLRGQVDDGLGLMAEFQDPALLRSRPEMRLRPLPGRHHGVDQSDVDRAGRRGPPLGDRVRPYDRDGIPVEVALPAPVMPIVINRFLAPGLNPSKSGTWSKGIRSRLYL